MATSIGAGILHPAALVLISSWMVLLASRKADAGPPKPPVDVQVVERIGAVVPPDLRFTNESGETVRLGDVYRLGRPVVLVTAYYRCPMLCGIILEGVGGAARRTNAQPGRDFNLLTISFSPDETSADAANRKRAVFARVGGGTQPAEGDIDPRHWPFWVGDQTSIDTLLRSLGVSVERDPSTGEFAHPTAFYVLTASGRISRYFYGFEPSPFELDLAIAEAGQGKTGSTFHRLLLSCFAYDPSTRKYGFAIASLYRAGGLVILIAAAFGLFLVIRARQQKQTPGA